MACQTEGYGAIPCTVRPVTRQTPGAAGHKPRVRPRIGADQRQGAVTVAKPLDKARPKRIAVECPPSAATATDGPGQCAHSCGSEGCSLGCSSRSVETGQRRITRGPFLRSNSLTCTDSTADGTGSTDCTGISRLPVPRPVPGPAVDRRSLPRYRADSAALFPGMNASQPSLGTSRTTSVTSCLA